MPRPAKERHPVRDLRKIIGKTQSGFAKSIGISPGGLKRIENNDLKLSPKIALRILAETGVNDEKLLAGKLRTEHGKKYTLDFYKRWKERYFKQNEQIAIDRAEALAWWIEILLRASIVGSKRRLWQVWRALADAIDECRRDFDLSAPVESILAKCNPRVKWNLAGRTSPELAEIASEEAAGDWHPGGVATKRPSKRSSSRRRAGA